MERTIESKKKFKPDPSLKLMEQVREVLRYHHYAYRTEQTYCDWIKRFLKFYDLRPGAALSSRHNITPLN